MSVIETAPGTPGTLAPGALGEESPGAPEGPTPSSGPTIDRIALLDWLLPNCERDRVAILYPKGRRGLSPGWVTGLRDATRAIEAYRKGGLSAESFTSVTHKGVPYKITKGERLGLVPHRNGRVATFCADLDDHTGDGGNVHVAAALSALLGAQPIVFTSKGGKGLHCFFRLAQPMDAGEFVTWVRAWGFNRQGEPEIFPKTRKNTQAWLPNEPNEAGGDAYVSGTFERSVVATLPPLPARRALRPPAVPRRGHGLLGQRRRDEGLPGDQGQAVGDAGGVAAAALPGVPRGIPDRRRLQDVGGAGVRIRRVAER